MRTLPALIRMILPRHAGYLWFKVKLTAWPIFWLFSEFIIIPKRSIESEIWRTKKVEWWQQKYLVVTLLWTPWNPIYMHCSNWAGIKHDSRTLNICQDLMLPFISSKLDQLDTCFPVHKHADVPMLLRLTFLLCHHSLFHHYTENTQSHLNSLLNLQTFAADSSRQ